MSNRKVRSLEERIGRLLETPGGRQTLTQEMLSDIKRSLDAHYANMKTGESIDEYCNRFFKDLSLVFKCTR